MAGNKDFIDILREIRGSDKPGEAYTDGIYYDITERTTDKNGAERLGKGIYGSMQVMHNDALPLIKHMTELLTASALSTEILSLYADKDKLESLYADKITLDSIYADKTVLDSLFADKATLDALFTDKKALDSLYNDKAKLDRIFASIDNIDTNVNNIANIDIVATDITNVNNTGSSITDVIAVSADLAKGIGTNQATDSSILNALTNANVATTQAVSAANSASAASISESNAATNESNALASANASKVSATNAAASETNAAASEAVTNANIVKTNADVVTTNNNAAITNADVTTTNANVITATEQANIATTQATNAASSATSASDSATVTTTQATDAANSAASASDSADTATAKATVATTEATNASNSANAANTSKDNAATSATNAATSANDAAASAANAAASSNSASASSDSASASATSATNSMNSASTSQTAAYNWATYTIDSPVPEGDGSEYSARHWANKAALAVTGSLTYMGSWDATTPYPTNPTTGAYYKVRIAGPETVGPYTYNPGDAIIYNGSSWDIIDGSDKVASVDGQLGNVDLSNNYEPKNSNIQAHISSTSNPHNVTKLQLGLGSVDDTSDTDKPISTATQNALNNKQDILSEGAFIDGDKTKLDSIESGATADQTKADIDALGINAATVNGKTVETSVPAGAVFTDTVYDDSTTLKDSDIGTTVQAYDVNTVVDSAYVHTDNNYTTTEKNKLAEVEDNATADQTASEILTAIKTVDGAGSGLDADLLDGMQPLALPISTATQTALDDKEPADPTILKSANIGVTVQGYSSLLDPTVVEW